MKKVRNFFIFLLLLSVAYLAVNARTDFFINIETYFPAFSQYFPNAAKNISDASVFVASVTNVIPTFSEIKAAITHEDLPIDPTDVAVNAYITDSPMLSFYPGENISVKISDGNISLFGIITDKKRQHIVVNILKSDGDAILQTSINVDRSNKFNKLISIPKTKETELMIAVYTGEKDYGDFESWVYKYLYISKDSGNWALKHSPVYQNNKSMYEKDKSISDALKSTPSIQSTNKSVIDLAHRVTEGKNTDYEKLTAIHDWVSSNISYDTDAVNNTGIVLPYSATEVMGSGDAVCLGFATLTAAMCRSVNIPCNVVLGFALGIGDADTWTSKTIASTEQNHAWNEAYVDGRWIILDATWDAMQKRENNTVTSVKSLSHLYFDANLEFFSANHKILEYQKRR